jgi:hypothetical protein
MAGFSLFQSFSLFLSRSNVKSKVRGNAVRHHVVSNPFHAVSIQALANSCAAVREFEGKRFLSKEAPLLPLKNCTAATCTCHYAHHGDRRAAPRRASDMLRSQNQSFRKDERRSGGGRRITDY